MIEALAVLIGLLIAPYLLIGRRETRDAAALADGAVTRIASGRHSIAVRDRGRGPTVVLIHGFGSWLTSWDRLQTALVIGGYRVIAVDLIGSGASSRSLDPHDYTTGAQARALIEVLQRMGIDRATLVGHSYGGRVALQMALYDPERVADIIAIAPETHATARPLIARVVTVPVLGYALAFWSTAPALIRFGLASVCRRTGWLDGERQATYAAPLHVRGHLAAQIVQSGSAKDSDMPVPRHYPHIHVPVHLIWGENDPVFAAKDGVAMVDQMRSCDLSVIPQCGHIPHEEAFDETWAVIQQHLPSRTVILPTIR